MKSIRCGWVALAAVLFAGAQRPAAAQEKPARWEALPADVCAVLIGPDQRRWYVENLDELKPTAIDAAKKCIAAEWGKPTPKLKDCWPVLFEKQGAVWFVMRDFRTIVRYDGTAWIEQATHVAADVRGGFTGMAPGRVNDGLMGNNAQAGDIRVFLESSGVCAFDGKNWAYQPLPNGSGRFGYSDGVTVLKEKDHQGVLVLQSRPPAMLRFRDGKWSRVRLPANEVRNVLVMPDGGVWAAVAQASEKLTLMRVALKGESADISGTFVWGKVNDRDVTPYIRSMSQEDDGTVIATCWVPREVMDVGEGQLVITPDGKSTFIAGNTWLPGARKDLDGHFWTTGWLNAWVECVDPTKEFSRRALYQIHGMHYLQTLAPDGTAYASYCDPLDWRKTKKPLVQGVVAYRCAGQEQRRVLSVNPVEHGNAAVGPDGTLYAAIVGKGLCRFNGKEFELEKAQGLGGGTLIPGRAGVMLRWSMQHDDTFSISDGAHGAESGSIATLVQENRALFVKGFGGVADLSIWEEPLERFRTSPVDFAGWSIAVDKQERVWVAFGRKLRVLGQDGKWLDIQWPVADGGARIPPNGPTLVTPIGDGDVMYVTNAAGPAWELKSRKGYVVKVEGDKAAWKEVPPSGSVWRKHNGDLVAVRPRQIPGKKGENPTYENVATVISADGAGDDWVLPGVPLLLDRSGYLWLGEKVDSSIHFGARFKLWKDGIVAGEAYVPGLCDAITTDGVGSVWVLAAGSLQHLVAPDAAKPAEYRVKETCVLKSPLAEIAILDQKRGLTAFGNGVMVKWSRGERNARGQPDPHRFLAIIPADAKR